MSEVQFVFPSTDCNTVSSMLTTITKAIVLKDNGRKVSGILGGEYGYGAEWVSDVFEMHPYCWCDRDECRMCNSEGYPNFIHKPTGFSVTWYKYIGRGMEVKGKVDLNEIGRECLADIAHH